MIHPLPPSSSGATLDLNRVIALYKSNETVRKLLDYFTNLTNNKISSPVDTLLAVLTRNGHAVTRGQLIEALRGLADLKCGTFKIGRKGHQSRMLWSVEVVSLGKAAAGYSTAVNSIEGEALDETVPLLNEVNASQDSMRLTYPLRQNLTVAFSLPKNLTQKEANRLADFIKTLPFKDEHTESRNQETT